MVLNQPFERLLKRELEKHGDAARAAEGLYAYALDESLEVAAVLAALRELPVAFVNAARAAERLFVENETLEVLTRERVIARRSPPREAPLELARLDSTESLEALRRVSARELQLALQRARPPEAKWLIQAWNLLPLYEQERPA